jgi:hypothetical protein
LRGHSLVFDAFSILRGAKDCRRATVEELSNEEVVAEGSFRRGRHRGWRDSGAVELIVVEDEADAVIAELNTAVTDVYLAAKWVP